MIKFYILALFVLATVVQLYGQVAVPVIIRQRTPSVSVNLGALVPADDLRAIDSRTRFTAGGSMAFPMGPFSPLEMGASVRWSHLGQVSNEVFFQTDDGYYTYGDMKAFGNLWQPALLMRLRPLNGGFRPYAEGFAGAGIYTLKSRLNDYDNQLNGDAVKLDEDIAPFAGWAAGAQIRLSRGVFLDLRYESLHSAGVTLPSYGDMTIGSDGVVSYSRQNVRPVYTTITAGVTFNF